MRFEPLLAAALLALSSGCQGNTNGMVIGRQQSAVQLRSYQARAFDTTDRTQTLRAVIATLQDLGFVIDKADATLGTVSATKLDRYQLRMTVTVLERGSSQTLVRANAQYGLAAVEEPGPYQRFFDALQQAMFLTAHQV